MKPFIPKKAVQLIVIICTFALVFEITTWQSQNADGKPETDIHTKQQDGSNLYHEDYISNMADNNVEERKHFLDTDYEIENGVESKPTCDKKETHVYYLKTHKTGSTTLSNILRRIVLNYNATFVAFVGAKHEDYFPQPILGKNRCIAPHPDDLDTNGHVISSGKTKKLDINMEHTVFNHKEVLTVMHADTKLTASVRHPFNHLKSSFNHYHMAEKLNIPKEGDKPPVERFLENLDQYWDNPDAKYVKNRMVGEFGLKKEREINDEYVEEYLGYLGKVFHNVLITEYLDEGLLIMKNDFCWGIKDILYHSQRSKSYAGKEKRPEEYGELYLKHREFSKIDYKLYEMFLDKHKMRVKELGPRFQSEIQNYKDILLKVNAFCDEFQLKLLDESIDDVTIMKMAELSLTIDATDFNEGFELNGIDCLLMRMSDFWIRVMLYARQYPNGCFNNKYPFKIVGSYCVKNNSDELFIGGMIPVSATRKARNYYAM